MQISVTDVFKYVTRIVDVERSYENAGSSGGVANFFGCFHFPSSHKSTEKKHGKQETHSPPSSPLQFFSGMSIKNIITLCHQLLLLPG